MIKEAAKRHSLIISAYSILVGLVLSLISRFFYVFVFLPDFHGSWLRACSILVDSEGWWAYLTSLFGFTITLVSLVLMLGVPVVLVTLNRMQR